MSEQHAKIASCVLSYLNDRFKKELSEINNPSYFFLEYIKKMALNAGKLYCATHPSKFIHSATESQNLVCKEFETINSILDTNSLDDIEFDTICSASFLNIHAFLSIEDSSGKKVIDYIKENDSSIFDFLDISLEEKQELVQQFKCAYKVDTGLKVDDKLKQIYFKVENGYKLLIPLFSSSLQQKIFDEIELKTRTELYQEARKAYKDNKQFDADISFYPQLAVMSIGGTQPQNVSYLNSSRAGKVLLFNNHPPKIHFQEYKIEPFTVNLFKSRLFSKNLKPLLSSLGWFFHKFKDDDSNKKLRHSRDVQLQKIADYVIDTICFCKDSNSEGFSDNLKLKLEHKYFIDKKYCVEGSIKTDALKVLAYDLAEHCAVSIDKDEFKTKLSFDNIKAVIDTFEDQFFQAFLRGL